MRKNDYGERKSDREIYEHQLLAYKRWHQALIKLLPAKLQFVYGKLARINVLTSLGMQQDLQDERYSMARIVDTEQCCFVFLPHPEFVMAYAHTPAVLQSIINVYDEIVFRFGLSFNLEQIERRYQKAAYKGGLKLDAGVDTLDFKDIDVAHTVGVHSKHLQRRRAGWHNAAELQAARAKSDEEWKETAMAVFNVDHARYSPEHVLARLKILNDPVTRRLMIQFPLDPQSPDSHLVEAHNKDEQNTLKLQHAIRCGIPGFSRTAEQEDNFAVQAEVHKMYLERLHGTPGNRRPEVQTEAYERTLDMMRVYSEKRCGSRTFRSPYQRAH